MHAPLRHYQKIPYWSVNARGPSILSASSNQQTNKIDTGQKTAISRASSKSRFHWPLTFALTATTTTKGWTYAREAQHTSSPSCKCQLQNKINTLLRVHVRASYRTCVSTERRVSDTRTVGVLRLTINSSSWYVPCVYNIHHDTACMVQLVVAVSKVQYRSRLTRSILSGGTDVHPYSTQARPYS